MQGIDWERVASTVGPSDLIAAILGALLAAWLTRRHDRKNFRRNFSLERATVISERLGVIFSRYTLESIGSVVDLDKILAEWGSEAERFDYLADLPTGRELNRLVQEYAIELRKYLSGGNDRSRVEHLRWEHNRAARGTLSRFLERHDANLQELRR